MATLLMRPADGGSADKKRRARKGKNAQKKQPQRGLGVAQLEKLRLQEQSLLCPTPPSYALRLSATDSDHPMARCDTDVLSQTVVSLTSSNVLGQAGGGGSTSRVVRGGEAGTLSRPSVLNGLSTTQSCLSPHPAHELSKSNVAEAFHAAAKRAVASRALACLSQSSKFSSVNPSFFSNVLTATQLQMLETQAHAQQKALEERRAAAASGVVEQPGNTTAAYIFPSVNNYFKEAPGNQVIDEVFKLHPVFKDHVQSNAPRTPSNWHHLESLIRPDMSHLPRKLIEFPVVGAPTSIVRTNSAKELSSFQSYASPQAWPSAEKVAGRKRPWLALQENSRHGGYAQALDLNAPLEESDAGYDERLPLRPNQVPEFRVGAHYTTGIVRNALGNSSLPPIAKIKVCSSGSQWQDNDCPSHVTAYFPEMGMYQEKAIGFRHCTSQASVKDSGSCVTGPSNSFARSRQKSLKDPDNIPCFLADKESICSNFLTLGISSSSYPDCNGWNEPEESIQDNAPTIMNEMSRFRQQDATTTSGCEGDNHGSLVRISICTQEVGGSDLKGDPRKSLSLEHDGGGVKWKSSMLLRDSHIASLSHYNDRFPSLPPPSIASNSVGLADESNIDCDPSTKYTRFVEESLDLRLKLAL